MTHLRTNNINKKIGQVPVELAHRGFDVSSLSRSSLSVSSSHSSVVSTYIDGCNKPHRQLRTISNHGEAKFNKVIK